MPGADARAQAEKTVRQLFRDDFARHSAAERGILAAKLLKAAEESSNDSTSLYVLLQDGREAAVAAGDAETAIAAVDLLNSRFDLDSKALEGDTLGALVRLRLTPESASAVANSAMSSIEKAAAEGDFDTVSRLSTVAESAASKTKWLALNARVQERLKSLKEARAEFERERAARQTLEKNPDDPDANLAVGRSLCLSKQDWTDALPLLAKGSDKQLKSLAAADLATDATSPPAEAAFARGAAWWAYAGTQTGAMKVVAERRAAAWYAQAADVPGLRKVEAEKRIQQADADATTYAIQHGNAIDTDPALIQARRDSLEKSATIPLAETTLKGPQTIPPGVRPYALQGTIHTSGATTITVMPGVEIRGGTFDMPGGGHIVATGAKGRPVIFRHVQFYEDLGASLTATGVIFDDCRFNKGGAWFASYSSRWSFNSCLLYACKFGALTEVDYGFQIKNCALVSMDFPEIQHPHGKGFNHVTILHTDANKIMSCDFVDCAVPPTVFWCAEMSNFRACKFLPGEAFESDKAWVDKAFVTDTIGPSPRRAWASNPPKNAPVQLLDPGTPFATPAWNGADALIPEFGANDQCGPYVVKKHLEK